MTDLANVSALTRTPVQMPVDWYFDPRIAAIERKVLFEQGPGYVGHELMVPEAGNYRSLAGMLHNLVALRWRWPRLGGWLQRVTPPGLDLYLNLYDIMYIVAERR